MIAYLDTGNARGFQTIKSIKLCTMLTGDIHLHLNSNICFTTKKVC